MIILIHYTSESSQKTRCLYKQFSINTDLNKIKTYDTINIIFYSNLNS